VGHPDQHLVGLDDYVPAGNGLQRRDQAHAAVFSLVFGIVKMLWLFSRNLATAEFQHSLSTVEQVLPKDAVAQGAGRRGSTGRPAEAWRAASAVTRQTSRSTTGQSKRGYHRRSPTKSVFFFQNNVESTSPSNAKKKILDGRTSSVRLDGAWDLGDALVQRIC